MIGAFYLTEKVGAPDFTDEDEELIELLAAHAAIAIANARLHERARELSIVEERNRLALDLHDAVSQKLFGLVLEAEAAATLLDRDPAAARDAASARLQGARAGGARRAALARLRAAPGPTSSATGSRGALRKHVEVLRRLRGTRSSSTVTERAEPRRRARRARCSGSRRRRSTTRSATRAPAASRCAAPATTAGSCSRSPTTASASTRTRPRCARGGSA